jgi:DNA-binding NarL/FixJ family response regulator
VSIGNGKPTPDDPAGVLICDDHEQVRGLLRQIVDGTPHLRVVGDASDGHQAIVEAMRLQPDVILLDLAMPKLNGLEALPELRRVAPAARILVFSGFSTANVSELVIRRGAAAYLEKGARPATIIATIEQVLRQRRPQFQVVPLSPA